MLWILQSPVCHLLTKHHKIHRKYNCVFKNKKNNFIDNIQWNYSFLITEGKKKEKKVISGYLMIQKATGGSTVVIGIQSFSIWCNCYCH